MFLSWGLTLIHLFIEIFFGGILNTFFFGTRISSLLEVEAYPFSSNLQRGGMHPPLPSSLPFPIPFPIPIGEGDGEGDRGLGIEKGDAHTPHRGRAPALSSFPSKVSRGTFEASLEKATNMQNKKSLAQNLLFWNTKNYETKLKKNQLINKLIGSITAPCALFINAFATFSLPKEMQESSPLVPALQSNWLMMHVTVMILSYAALILGSLLSIGFLIVSSTFDTEKKSQIIRNEPENKLNLLKNEFNSNLGVLTNIALKAPIGNIQADSQSLFISNGQSEVSEGKENLQQTYRFTLAKNLDNLSYRILGLGFPLLTIGILSGAVWANEAWGSYWSWDPKETWALLTWLVFAIYLHTRLTKGWQGKKPALIASLGFITVWICFLGVNLIGEGLHSYGWLS